MGKLTPWFGPEIKPVRNGIYEIGYIAPHIGFSYWDGTDWRSREFTLANAQTHRDQPARGSIVKWRGLSRKPK